MSETDKKPTGPAKAAKEIADSVTVEGSYHEWLQNKYTAIILKHCPEDKTGKLVETLTEVESLMRVGVWNRREFSDLLKRVQATLATYKGSK